MIKCSDNTDLISFMIGIFCLIPELCYMCLCPQCREPVTDSCFHFDSDKLCVFYPKFCVLLINAFALCIEEFFQKFY